MKKESFGLHFFYHTFIGRVVLKIVTIPFFSKVIGWFLCTKFSKIFIKRFIVKNEIDLDEYEEVEYKSFNDFFSRQIKKEKRVISKNKKNFIAPCDGLLSVYEIKKGLVIPVKQSEYTISSLLQDEKLAQEFQEGYVLVFRLCVNYYHRYCYLDDGYHSGSTFIKGRLHTVRPIALESRSVFTENSREVTVLETDHFGDVVQIEVGALCVGKIKNYYQEHLFKKGEEKGMFLFGGSTIILLVKDKTINIFDKYLSEEKVFVKMGQKIGEKL